MQWIRTLCVLTLGMLAAVSAANEPPVRMGQGGELAYTESERGDRVPDFSVCGFAGADRDLPDVAPRLFVTPSGGDDTVRIQSAIEHIASLEPDQDGYRGAVCLTEGDYHVGGGLRVSASGVALRGAGADRTRIIATGHGRRPLVRIAPMAHTELRTGTAISVAGDYTPVGATTIRLTPGHGLRVGEGVVVSRPSTDSWIEALGARVHGIGWREGRCDIRWQRNVVGVAGDQITLDAPITTALDTAFGGGTVAKVLNNPRLKQVGVQDLTLVSEVTGDNSLDENHSWHGVVVNDTEDLWVTRVRFEGFAGGAVLLREGVRRATVSDCLALAPVSELAGYRRQSFFTQGQQTLFLRCWAEQGLNDFSVGHCAAGPNAFVQCYAKEIHGESGPLESWASGVLYDNVRIEGGDLFLGNRWLDPPGAGWAAANCMAWQCQSAQLQVFKPPTAQNWAVGFWAQPIGDGDMHGLSDFVRPTSLYHAQLSERLGDKAAERAGEFLLDPIASTSPTIEEAQAFVDMSNDPPRTLRDLIEENLIKTRPIEPDPEHDLERVVSQTSEAQSNRQAAPIRIENGWITRGGEVVTGSWLHPTWWRGVIRPNDAPAFGPSISRFAPGRYGHGLTDELPEVVAGMLRTNRAVYDHHYGLWYDRRRDDHLMVRRATGEVAPPYYEQPFARSGEGTAWDGLSRYDLEEFNPWYWDRLAEFAALAEHEGIVLAHQCYFQHNIIEAGAHWADCPWRPANNINETGLTEPPPYVGDKRIFIAHQFYGPGNPRLRELHRGYLRQCVENFRGRSNVIQFTSAEFTGPQEFAEFWVDTVSELRGEVNANTKIGLSTTKDVQDAVLSDATRRQKIDVIDIRYWCYDQSGGLYAPPGGANMAMRQHMRQMKAEPANALSIARAVSEYRLRYPGKAVTFTAYKQCRAPNDGWAVLMAGGSLAAVPPLPKDLKRALVRMQPVASAEGDYLVLDSGSGEQLVYALETQSRLQLPMRGGAQSYDIAWIDPETGAVTANDRVEIHEESIEMKQRVAWIKPSSTD